jgi:predicted RNA-binding Zn ribbon-like protein
MSANSLGFESVNVKRDTLAAVQAAQNEIWRERGLFVALADSPADDGQLAAALGFVLADLWGDDVEVTADEAQRLIVLCRAIRDNAFRLDTTEGAYKPAWRNKAARQAVSDALHASGLVTMGLGEDFRPELLPARPAGVVAIHALEVAADGIEVRQCPECGAWFAHGRNGALFCSTRCGGRARVRKHRSKQQ